MSIEKCLTIEYWNHQLEIDEKAVCFYQKQLDKALANLELDRKVITHLQRRLLMSGLNQMVSCN